MLITNLISYYNLNGNSTDIVGGRNGTDVAVSYSLTNGRISQGAGFNGTTSQITNTSTFSTIISDMSMSFWVNTSQVPSGFNQVFIKWQAASNAQFIAYLGSSTANMTFLAIDSVGNTGATSAGSLSDGKWHHVVMTKAANLLSIYVDGIFIASNGTTTFTGNYNNLITYFGFDGGTRFFTGNLDEIGLWSRALSASEVTNLFNNGTGLAYPFGSGIFMELL